MELNPKLLQYSLDVKLSQSKIIKSNHDHHLRKLKQIQHQSKSLLIKQKTKSLKQITDSVHKYHQVSRNFKSKQMQQKRCSQDFKMIRSLSQIYQNRHKQQKMHQQINKNVEQYKQRNQNHRKLISLLKNKQLEERNLKIAIRISRQQNDFSYVEKIKNQIKEYSKIRKNLQKSKMNQQQCQEPRKIVGRRRIQNYQQKDVNHLLAKLKRKDKNIIQLEMQRHKKLNRIVNNNFFTKFQGSIQVKFQTKESLIKITIITKIQLCFLNSLEN